MLDNKDFKILVVDDEEFNIDVVFGFLEPLEYQLRYTTNGTNALKAAKNHDFDLILLDINMPDIDGLEVCRRLKADEKTKDVPVIFLSALNDIDTITKAFTAGGIDYITKPFNGLELIARVNTQIELRKYIHDIKSKQERLAQIASTDIQTGLANRIRFISVLKSACENPKEPLNMLFLSLDHLSKINDMYGFHVGDRLISLISSKLQTHKREQDFIARIFGSEFVMLMPKTTLEGATQSAKELYASIKESADLPIKISCSIAIMSYEASQTPEKFLKSAQALAHKIKSNGGNMIANKNSL